MCSVMNKIVKYLIVILSFLSISLSINAFPVNTDCRFGGEVLDVDGICGGYNLTWAYTSADAAANDLIKVIK